MFINKGETCLLQFIMCQKSFIPFHHYVKEAINKAGECLRIKFSSAKLMHLSSALENGSNYGKSTFVVVVGGTKWIQWQEGGNNKYSKLLFLINK